MPNGVLFEAYAIAKKNDDGSLPNEDAIYDERIYFTREDAEEALDDFQPYMRDGFDIFIVQLEITEVSKQGTIVIPANDNEDDDAESVDALPVGVDRVALYTSCKQFIVDWCSNNRSALDSEFVSPLTDAQFNDTCDISNWMTSSEKDASLDADEHDYDDVLGWCFDCTPFMDELRAYVRTDDSGNPTHVVVQGE